ncbi:MAG: tripartite tricarboxylate transporter permease [Candidatus Methanoplasma sp.]|jgi:putative membrane protein|nr:tripartite tricarboxylate transporter permease [Candidatus Methanoplasma sp.]
MEPYTAALILAACAAGSAAGCLTGLFPGIHVNTLASLALAAYPAAEPLLSSLGGPQCAPLAASSFLVSAAVTHSFLDFVPSVFLGAPGPDEAMSVLPGHRLLMEGRGMAAVRAAAAGSLIGSAAAVALAVPFRLLMAGGMEGVVSSLTASVVLFTVLATLICGRGLRRAAWAAALMGTSGLLGIACMSGGIPSGGALGEGTLLFPLLSGLFGMPALLSPKKGARTPPQRDEPGGPSAAAPGLKGVLVGCVAGWYPGVTATSGAALASTVSPERSPEGFIALTASIGTVTAVFSLVALSVSGSGRSGVAMAVRDIAGAEALSSDAGWLCAMLACVAVSSAIGYAATIAAGRAMSRMASGADASKANRCAAAIVASLVLLLTGPWGLAVLAVATVVGSVPQAAGVDRVPLAGCLLVPVLLSCLGASV